MQERVAVIAMGAMGASVGARLTQNGVTVLTSFEGRSAASVERATAAGMRDASLAEIAEATIFLSIVPPRDALATAERLAPALAASKRKPLYIDCNATSTATVKRVAKVVEATGTPFVDANIIGPPMRPGSNGTVLYVCGVAPERLELLRRGGLEVVMVDGPLGAASALKMAYAAITKGLTGLACASVLAAEKEGAGPALRAELQRSQPNLLAMLERAVPDMFPKAYRFVGEMNEVAQQSDRESAAMIYRGIAALYQEIADDLDGGRHDIAALEAFFKSKA